MKSSARAFTFIELLISITIIAILSIGVAINFKESIVKANLEDHVSQIVHILQQARGYSLTNFLVNDTEPADYYVVTITSSAITLKVYGATDNETLESMSMDTGYTITGITSPERIYYFPPTGEICFTAAACTSADTELTLTVTDSTGNYTQDISLSKFGGSPELEE